jgi:hypothetical protein
MPKSGLFQEMRSDIVLVSRLLIPHDHHLCFYVMPFRERLGLIEQLQVCFQIALPSGWHGKDPHVRILGHLIKNDLPSFRGGRLRKRLGMLQERTATV